VLRVLINTALGRQLCIVLMCDDDCMRVRTWSWETAVEKRERRGEEAGVCGVFLLCSCGYCLLGW
jgi:hypothetical protein